MVKRYGLVRGRNVTAETVTNYLPGNYRVIWSGKVSDWSPTVEVEGPLDDNCVVIQGEDNRGWTLDRYVIPRLGSGLMRCDEIDLSSPAMRLIPA